MDLWNSEEERTLFAELLLPVPVPKLFTYRVPRQFAEMARAGQRAIVQFGDRKILTGVIVNVHDQPPKEYEAKYVLELLDDYPVVNAQQLELFHWMASYYLCTTGEVINAALPSGLKLSSESVVQLHPAFNLEETALAFSEKELILLKRLEHETLSYSDISKLLGVKHLYTILKSLASKEAIILYEEVKEKYRPKVEKKVRLREPFLATDGLEQLFQELADKPKQEAVILKYLQEVPVMHDASVNKDGLAKRQLLAGDISESSLQTLIKHGVFEEYESIVPRFALEDHSAPPVILLSEEQQRAQGEIFRAFETQSTVLLHGITGSGKTELYINLIKKALESESQVLYLLPEIALTTQIVQRLRKIFGNAMGVYHSKFSDAERVEVWTGILTGRFKFVVGVRSAIFLPFDNLGLIIVDEEHDASYKQQEPAPRYHARDVALILAQLHHAKVVLGSATPSVESYYQAKQGRYGLVKLAQRFGLAQLPEVVLADMGRERKQKTVKGDFSALLLKDIATALGKKEQVIIFQNRRGYSPMVTCEDCGWVPKCVNCAVSLTYHQYKNEVVCHYCGYKETMPQQCPSCTSTRLQTVGYGTEKLEEELKLHFPDAATGRMDLDTTRSRSGYEHIIDQFERGETDILVGTQMVTKGLDFDRVSLVGVFNADRMMHFPDFRSYERAYQLITQVSGRAGRRDIRGKVVIQTASPDHTVLVHILQNDFEAFYNREIADREQHYFPPFARLIEITVKHADKKTCRDMSHQLAELLATRLRQVRLLGPGEPVVSKIRNQYLMTLLIKIPRGKGELHAIKEKLAEAVSEVMKEKAHRTGRVIVDVDPV